MIEQIAEILGMSAEQIQAIFYTLLTGVVGISIRYGYVWLRSLQNDVKNAREERKLDLEKIRSDMRLREKAQSADEEERRNLLELLRTSTMSSNESINNLAQAIREDSQSRQKLDRELEEQRDRTYRENTEAIHQLKSVLEIQSRHYQDMQKVVKEVQIKTEANSTSYHNLETRIESFLLEIRTTIDNYNDDHAAHVEAAGERQKTITTLSSKVDEILAILKPPPKPPLELHPEKLKKTDKNETEQENVG